MASQIQRVDHSVFGDLVISQQSTRDIREASFMFKGVCKGDSDSDDNLKYAERKKKYAMRSKSISAVPFVTARHVYNRSKSEMHSSEETVPERSQLSEDSGDTPIHPYFVNRKQRLKHGRSFSIDSTMPYGKTNEFRERLLSHGSRSLSRESSMEEPKNVSRLVDELLLAIYGEGGTLRRRLSSAQESDCCSTSGTTSSWRATSLQRACSEPLQQSRLQTKDLAELRELQSTLRAHVQFVGSLLVRQLKRRETLRSRREKHNDVITALLQAMSPKRSEDTRMRFSVMPYPGDSGFIQWRDAMKMVARLPGGIPPDFRRRLWLTLAEKHLQARGVNWCHAERFCFNEWSNPDDDELGVQIVKDLHRTGCSLFCGAEAEQNQALLKRVLLAYARWNKAVGYCQGFNMLAALILQVMDRSETDSVKVMIYLIEGVLPESYFANNLRGLSVDMAVFRDLLRLRLPTLSRHLEQLQHDARDNATGTSYEPPLTNVFTMQWFLTLFSNCLPQSTVLRVWDLIFLEGNEVLLRTALAIWDGLADRILAVDSADEFYSIMGVLTREMLEFGLMDTNNLVKTIVTIAPFPFPELSELRDKYLYNITPWTQTVSTAAKRGLRLFYSDDDDETDEDDEKIAVATAYGISTVFRSPRRKDSMNRSPSPSTSLSALNYTTIQPDRDRLALDISALKHQYAKLRERQRQAHIILTAACARQPLGPSAPTPVAMNHLLLGKSALLSVRGRRVGPPPGAVPPPSTLRVSSKPHKTKQLHVTTQGQLIISSKDAKSAQTSAAVPKSGETLHWRDATAKKKPRRSSEDNSKEIVPCSGDETNAGSTNLPVIIEPEVVSPDDKVSADSDSSSTSTELCDEPDRLSDFDSEEPTSISDASSYAPDITKHSTNKSPVMPESTLVFPVVTISEVSPDDSTDNSEMKISTHKDISRNGSLDSITECQDVPTQTLNRCSEDSTNICITVKSVEQIPTSVSSSSTNSSKEMSPSEQESILNSLNHSLPTSPIEKTDVSMKNDFDAEFNKSQFHTSASDTGLCDVTQDTGLTEDIPDLNTSLSFKQTSPSWDEKSDQSIEFNLLHMQVPNTTESEKICSSALNEEWFIKEKLLSMQNEDIYFEDQSVRTAQDVNISPVENSAQDDLLSFQTEDKCNGNDDKLAVANQSSSDNTNESLKLLTDVQKVQGELDITTSLSEFIDHSSKERSIDDEDMSMLLEINHKLHCQEVGLEELTNEQDKLSDKGSIKSDEIIDYAKMSELLDIDHKMNLGRRNSERALKIIQENSEILHRILQCQARRQSKLSEEESNGTNLASEDESNVSSIPTSSSLENVDIVPSTLVKPISDEALFSKPTDGSKEEDHYKKQPDVLEVPQKQPSLELDLSDLNKEVKLAPIPTSDSPIVDITDKITSYDKLFSSILKESLSDTSVRHENTSYTTESKCMTTPLKTESDLLRGSENDTSPDIIHNFKPFFKPLLLSPLTPELPSASGKVSSSHVINITGITKSNFKPKLIDDPYPSSFESKIHSSWAIPSHDSAFSTPSSNETSENRFGFKSEKLSSSNKHSYDSLQIHTENDALQLSADKIKTKPLYMPQEDPLLPTHTSENSDKYSFSAIKSSEISFQHTKQEDLNISIQSSEPVHSRPSSTCSSPLYQKSKSKLIDTFSSLETTDSYKPSMETKKYTTTSNYSEIPRAVTPPLLKETVDYFHLDSSSFLPSPSKSEDVLWNHSLRHAHPSTCKRRRESDEHFRRRPSSSSPRRRTSEDFPFDLRPFLTSSLSDSRTDLVQTKTVRESRPPSPTVSDSFTDLLNRSSSSSSLHGYHSQSKKDLTSPPSSPFMRYTPPLRKNRERPVSLHFDTGGCFESNKDTLLQSRTSPLYKSFSMLSVTETALPIEKASPYEEMDKSRLRRRTSTDVSLTLPRTKGKLSRVSSPIYSPTKSKEFYISLPPIKTSHHSSPTKSPMKFNPFPPRASTRQPKELGVKLGLYSITSDGTKGKATEKST